MALEAFAASPHIHIAIDCAYELLAVYECDVARDSDRLQRLCLRVVGECIDEPRAMHLLACLLDRCRQSVRDASLLAELAAALHASAFQHAKFFAVFMPTDESAIEADEDDEEFDDEDVTADVDDDMASESDGGHLAEIDEKATDDERRDDDLSVAVAVDALEEAQRRRARRRDAVSARKGAIAAVFFFAVYVELMSQQCRGCI